MELRQPQNLKKDYLWNTLGVSVSSFLSLFLLIVVARINGLDGAGLFSFCFSYALVFFSIGYYGGRIYQVSDVDGAFENRIYILQKFITSAIMLIVAVIFVLVNRYDAGKAALLLVLVLVKVCEAISDALYGVLQRNGRLYLSGISLTGKGALGFCAFLLIDLLMHSLVYASLGTLAVNILMIFCFDVPCLRRTSHSSNDSYDSHVNAPAAPNSFGSAELKRAFRLMRNTVTVFLMVFFSSLIINIPRYFVDIFHEDMQGYFGMVVMPATAVVLFGTFIIQPKIVPLSQMLEARNYPEFKKTVRNLLIISILFGLFATALAYFFGVPVLNYIYGFRLDSFRLDIALIVLGGTANVIVMVCSSILVIMRKLKIQIILYLFVIVLIVVLSVFLIDPYSVAGAVFVYLIANATFCIAYLIVYKWLISKEEREKQEAYSYSIDAKITVIVPVYNGEKYLRRCLDSILSQSIGKESLELIVVDDGSLDSSFEIIMEYQKNDPDIIRGISQENAGVAVTRNRAILMAEGAYVAFVDQDDWLDSDYLETYYKVLKSGDYEMVFGGYKRPNSQGKIVKNLTFSDAYVSRYLLTAPWARLMKKSLIDQSGAMFFQNLVGEDTVFVFQKILASEKLKSVGSYCGYNWFFNEKSVSNTKQKALTPEIVDAIESLFDELTKYYKLNGKFEEKNPVLQEWFIIRVVIFYLLYAGRQSSKSVFEEAENRLFSHVAESFPGFEKNRYFHRKAKGEKWFAFLAVRLFLFFHVHGLIRKFAHFYCKNSN